MAQQRDQSDNPRDHTRSIKRMLNDVITRVQGDVEKVSDSKAQALFETTAEVLQGLVNAYDHYWQKSEKAWR